MRSYTELPQIVDHHREDLGLCGRTLPTEPRVETGSRVVEHGPDPLGLQPPGGPHRRIQRVAGDEPIGQTASEAMLGHQPANDRPFG